MAGLPPRPREYDDYPTSRYPPDDRGRPIPMAPDRYSHPHPRDYYSSRSPHPPRSRPSYAVDSYVATDSYVAPSPAVDSYVAPGYDRRGDEDRYKVEWDRYHAHERERRGVYDRDMARYDHDRGYDRRRGDARDRDYHPAHSERDRRWEGRSSPRRPTASRDYPADHREPFRQHPSPSRRQPSPRYRPRSHSRTRSPSPRHKLKLGNHSISNSPRSSSKPNLVRDSRSASPRRTVTPPRHRLPRRSRSPSPEKGQQNIIDVKREKSSSFIEPSRDPVVEEEVKPQRTPTTPSSHPPPTFRVPVKSDAIPTGPRIRPALKPEIVHPNLPTGPSFRYTEKEKGKQREQPTFVTDSEGETKMRSSSPSPPREPRARPSVRGHSPPRGPRNAPRNTGWVKTPTTPMSPASFHLPTKPGWNSRNASMNTGTPFLQPVQTLQSPLAKPTEPEVTLPAIPVYKPKPSITLDLDAEISRIQAHRAHLVSEYTIIGQRTRRALHELDMAAIDLRAAESRRKVAGSHMEKARAGILGIDAVPVDNKTP